MALVTLSASAFIIDSAYYEGIGKLDGVALDGT